MINGELHKYELECKMKSQIIDDFKLSFIEDLNNGLGDDIINTINNKEYNIPKKKSLWNKFIDFF